MPAPLTFTQRSAEEILARVDLFLDTHTEWKQMSLLKASGQDHRFLARVKAGESFRTASVDALYATIEKAEKGNLDPADFRSSRADARAKAARKVKATKRKAKTNVGRTGRKRRAAA